MGDADAVVGEVRRKPGVKYTALWMNERGSQRALATGNFDIQGSMALSAIQSISPAQQSLNPGTGSSRSASHH
jgi:hydroxymethylglutaryl-CoA lyase